MVNFDAVIKSWLDAHPEDRDPTQGALLLLKLDRNQVAYRAHIANPQRYLPKIQEALKAHLDRRRNIPSQQQTEQLVAEAEDILATKDCKEIKSGKRADHDSLPENIRKLYEDNLDLRRRRSLYHSQIQILRTSKADCSREDIRDLVALLKKTDIMYRENWKKYDNYGK